MLLTSTLITVVNQCSLMKGAGGGGQQVNLCIKFTRVIYVGLRNVM